jgi:hypothetical protein
MQRQQSSKLAIGNTRARTLHNISSANCVSKAGQLVSGEYLPEIMVPHTRQRGQPPVIVHVKTRFSEYRISIPLYQPPTKTSNPIQR